MGRRLLALGLLGVLAVAAAAPVLAAGSSVRMGEANERYFFAPTKTFVNVGGSVTWKNGTDVAHTVTSDSGSELASGDVAAAGTFSHTFMSVGTFRYHCTIHPYMTATVVVLGAGVTPPPTSTLAATATDGGAPLAPIAIVIAGLAGAGLTVRRFRAMARR